MIILGKKRNKQRAQAREGGTKTASPSGRAPQDLTPQLLNHADHDHTGHNGDHSGHDHAAHDHSAHDHTGHDHSGHDHDHAGEIREMARTNRKRLLIVALSGTLVMAAEIIGGVLANSLVLLADAAHYATDVAAVLIAFLAVTLAMRPATLTKTFGYKRAEVLAAFFNAAALWGISVYFIYESYERILHPPNVAGPIVMAVGAFTLVANGFLALLLMKASGHNINMKGAYLHILSDVLGSAAALSAGVLVYFFGWHIADPILTLFITLLILTFTWKLTKETLNILLEGTPAMVDMAKVEETIRSTARVKEVHELHAWTITSGSDMLSVHVVLEDDPHGDQVTHDIHEALRTKFKIDHVTVQVESPACPCRMARCYPAAIPT